MDETSNDTNSSEREADQSAQGSSQSKINTVSGGIKPGPPRVSGTIWIVEDPAPDPPDTGKQSTEEIREEARSHYSRMLKEDVDTDRLEREKDLLEEAMQEQRSHMRRLHRTIDRLEKETPRPEFRGPLARNIIRLRRKKEKFGRAYDALRLRWETLKKVVTEWHAGAIPDEAGENPSSGPGDPVTKYMRAYADVLCERRDDEITVKEKWQGDVTPNAIYKAVTEHMGNKNRAAYQYMRRKHELFGFSDMPSVRALRKAAKKWERGVTRM